jgi:hypothetical protein
MNIVSNSNGSNGLVSISELHAQAQAQAANGTGATELVKAEATETATVTMLAARCIRGVSKKGKRTERWVQDLGARRSKAEIEKELKTLNGSWSVKRVKREALAVIKGEKPIRLVQLAAVEEALKVTHTPDIIRCFKSGKVSVDWVEDEKPIMAQAAAAVPMTAESAIAGLSASELKRLASLIVAAGAKADAVVAAAK